MDPPARPMREWHSAWWRIFAANVSLPLVFGMQHCSDEGSIGMCATVGLLWGATHFAVGRSHMFRVVVLPGAVCTAVSQVFPVIHFVAVSAGVRTLERFREPPSIDHGGPLSVMEACLLTAVTGGLLLLAAFVLGVFCFPITRSVLGVDDVVAPRFKRSEDATSPAVDRPPAGP